MAAIHWDIAGHIPVCSMIAEWDIQKLGSSSEPPDKHILDKVPIFYSPCGTWICFIPRAEFLLLLQYMNTIIYSIIEYAQEIQCIVLGFKNNPNRHAFKCEWSE